MSAIQLKISMQFFPLTQADMQNQGEKARELFCQVVRTFIQNYGLQSDGHDRRKEEQKQALVEARLTEDDLKTGILFLLSLYFHSLPYGLIATLFAIKPRCEVNIYSMIDFFLAHRPIFIDSPGILNDSAVFLCFSILFYHHFFIKTFFR